MEEVIVLKLKSPVSQKIVRTLIENDLAEQLHEKTDRWQTINYLRGSITGEDALSLEKHVEQIRSEWDNTL